ncbi:MAG: MlaD family protein [Spirochaetaceae bacterium]|jgi:phospholipid/cholesterol/gamma-HCH transport system substrate-binding protein|nr:MlaD family protein [Spirochaetaceae bacterium]
MKFRIRYADQIVGAFLIVAFLALVFAVVILGHRQRWFARNYSFKTYFDSAAGLSSNMAIQYKGITIGNVKSFKLTPDDQVEVIFAIQDTYIDRVKRGSLVDINVSPIGLGNQFRFYPGLGQPLEQGELIPQVNSPEGKALVQSGLAYLPSHDDNISILLGQINTLVADIDSALKGTDATSLGRTFLGIEETVTGVAVLPDTVKQTVDSVVSEIAPILADIQQVTTQLSDPEGTVATVLDGKGAVYVSLENSLQSLAGILKNIDKTTSYLPADMPQVAALLTEVRATIQTAEDVLVSLTNNPLLKGGIPAKAQTQSSGTSPRDIAF